MRDLLLGVKDLHTTRSSTFALDGYQDLILSYQKLVCFFTLFQVYLIG